MTQPSWQNEIKASFERLSAKSAAAQAQIFKDTIEFMKQAGEKKVDMASVSKTGTSLLAEAVAAYTQLHIDYASKIIDLGLSFTHGMLSSIDKGAAPSGAPAASQEASGKSAFALQLSGMPGDCCQTAFILDSTKKKPVVASFRYTTFRTPDGSRSLTLPLRFDPPEAAINPDQKIRIVLEVPIPLDAKPGQYEASAWIADVPEMNFKIVLLVAGATEKTPPASPAPAKRKRSGTGTKTKK